MKKETRVDRSRRMAIGEVALFIPLGLIAYFTGHTTVAGIFAVWTLIAMGIHGERLAAEKYYKGGGE
jgi:hypothetical protein